MIPHYIYAISSKDFNYVKLGRWNGYISKLMQRYNTYYLDYNITVFECHDSVIMESQLLMNFKEYKLRGELFRPEVLDVIFDYLESLSETFDHCNHPEFVLKTEKNKKRMEIDRLTRETALVKAKLKLDVVEEKKLVKASVKANQEKILTVDEIVSKFINEKCTLEVGNKILRIDSVTLWNTFQTWLFSEKYDEFNVTNKQFKNVIDKITNHSYKTKVCINRIMLCGWLGLSSNTQIEVEINIITRFIKDKCTLKVGNKNLRVDAVSLWNTFQSWLVTEQHGVIFNNKQFKEIINNITKHDYKNKIKVENYEYQVRGWYGISLENG
jgi:hypothetical protein